MGKEEKKIAKEYYGKGFKVGHKVGFDEGFEKGIKNLYREEIERHLEKTKWNHDFIKRLSKQ